MPCRAEARCRSCSALGAKLTGGSARAGLCVFVRRPRRSTSGRRSPRCCASQVAGMAFARPSDMPSAEASSYRQWVKCLQRSLGVGGVGELQRRAERDHAEQGRGTARGALSAPDDTHPVSGSARSIGATAAPPAGALLRSVGSAQPLAQPRHAGSACAAANDLRRSRRRLRSQRRCCVGADLPTDPGVGIGRMCFGFAQRGSGWRGALRRAGIM